MWSQAGVVASLLAYLPHQRHLSVARFAASEQHYMRAAEFFLTALSSLLPTGLRWTSVHGLLRALGPTGAFYLVHTAVVLLGVLITLVVLFRFELPCRMHVACERGLGDAVNGLWRRRSQWRRLGIPHCVLLVAAGWTAGCLAMLPFRAAGLFGRA